MGKRSKEETEEEVAAAELAAKKAAKKAKKAAAAAAAEAEEEEDPAASKKAAKKAKKAAAAASAEAEEEEDPEAAALAAKKAAKKAKKAAAAAAAEEEEEDPEAAALAAKKAAKKAKKAAAAAAAEEEEDEAEEPVKKKTKEAPEEEEEPAETGGKGKGKKGKSGDNALTVFVRGLPFSTTQEVLQKDFAECGEVVSCRMPLNDDGQCKGIAFIAYADKESMDKALAFNETDYGGRTIYCVPASDKPDGKGKGKDGKDGKGKGDNALTVCVRGLPFATTEEALKKDFAECGELKSCRMLLNDEGQCRGIAFIAYADKEGMDKALAFNETDYGGRTIYCSPAADKPDGKGKGKDGKDKGKGKGKGKKGKAPSEAKAKSSGAMVESTGTKQTFDDSDDE